MTDVLISPKAVAQILGVNVKTLEGWRRTGVGPAWQKVGPKLVRYPESGVRIWAADQAMKTRRSA